MLKPEARAARPMAAGGSDILLAGAIVVFIGVVASLVFERYRVPDVVLLLLVGIALGPVGGWLDADAFAGFADAFTTLALVVILFEGGLDLNVRLLRRSVSLTTILLLASYVATAAALAVVVRVLAGFDWPVAALFGLAMAPLSSSILISLVGRLGILPETRALLTVESALGDVLAVLATFTLADALVTGGLDVAGVGRSLGASFLVGGGAALALGVVWLGVLRLMRDRPYAYLVTFAVSLLLLGAVEQLGGNGVVAVLVFALVLGNAELLKGWLPGVARYEITERIRWFHAEMAFFVRTFFFIYLGLLVTFEEIGWRFAGYVLALVLAILLVRAAVVWAVVKQRPRERQDIGYLSFLIPRGLASAAIAGAPGVLLIARDEPLFLDLAFALILVTNLVMTGYILWKEHGFGTGAEPEAALVEPEMFAALDLEGLQRLDERIEP